MKRGAICGTLCGLGFVVCAGNLIQTSDVTASVMCIVGTLLFAAGCMGLAIGAWRE